MTSLSDLLSDTPPPRKRGRPTREEAAARKQAEEYALKALPHESEFRRPVGITFIATVFGKQPRQIAKRLEKCAPAEWTFHQGKKVPLYDFVDAIAYLVPPKGDIEDWFAQQNQASLPPLVSKAFWDSMNGRIRAMQKAGQLWHDDEVLTLLGRVLMMIKSETKGWIEELPDAGLLTDEQYTAIIDMMVKLEVKIKDALVDAPRQFLTQSMAHTIMEEIEDATVLGYDENASESD